MTGHPTRGHPALALTLAPLLLVAGCLAGLTSGLRGAAADLPTALIPTDAARADIPADWLLGYQAGATACPGPEPSGAPGRGRPTAYGLS